MMTCGCILSLQHKQEERETKGDEEAASHLTHDFFFYITNRWRQ